MGASRVLARYLLHALDVRCNTHVCIVYRWTPPPNGALQLNFDGSALGNPGMAGLGSMNHPAIILRSGWSMLM